MDCPVCKTEPMVVLELNQVEIDHCLGCGGIWLDSGELELLLDSSKEKDSLLTSFVADKQNKEQKRRCPICLKKMDKILCVKGQKVLIDKCRKNHGLWFDKGELPQIIKMGSLDRANKIIKLLEDIFTKKVEIHK